MTNSNKANFDTMTLDEIKADIDRARTWALQHFNVGAELNSPLDPPVFLVEFPEPDIMRACPRIYGKPFGFQVEYRLCWRIDGTLVWMGVYPAGILEVD